MAVEVEDCDELLPIPALSCSIPQGLDPVTLRKVGNGEVRAGCLPQDRKVFGAGVLEEPLSSNQLLAGAVLHDVKPDVPPLLGGEAFSPERTARGIGIPGLTNWL